MRRIKIIDGNSLLFRAYFATAWGENPSIMRTKDGTPTNAIFAFSNMLAKLLGELEEGDAIVIGFDKDGQTFRKDRFEAYKANRKPAPTELKAQFPLSRELCKALGIIAYEEHGIEADDICGTIARMASEKGYEALIYTSDKDYLQLIDEHVSVALLKTGLSKVEIVNEGNMRGLFGFSPRQIIDFKGLRGDASDNLPGIPGIGDKTAVKLIAEYGSFAEIVKAAPTMKGKIGKTIIENEAQGRECLELATIKTDVVLPFSLDDLVYKGYSFEEVSDFASRYELKSLLGRLPTRYKRGEETSFKWREVESFAGISLPPTCGLALDIDYGDYHDAPLLGIALSSETEAYYMPAPSCFHDETLIRLLGSESERKCLYDLKASAYALRKEGIALRGVSDDLMLGYYLLDAGTNLDPAVVYNALGADIGDPQSASLLAQRNVKRTALMALHAARLAKRLRLELNGIDSLDLYLNVELPLASVLAKMEFEGVPLHQDELLAYGEEFGHKRDEAAQKAYELAGGRLNLNSPKQVAELLFSRLHLPDRHRGATNVQVLEELRGLHPIIEAILEYRKYAKLISTYIEGLIPHIKADGKIHSYFNQAQTSTGRLSSSAPNLQNISVRDEESAKIRSAFHYDDPETVFLSLDYHQIELRILAALSGDASYQGVFNSGHDVHSETAKRIFHVEEVTPALRRKAKAVNFAIIYGTTVYGLANQIEGSLAEAQAIIGDFYSAYPEVAEYLAKIGKEATDKGYVSTLFGRRRYLRDVNDPNRLKAEAARRQALNAPIQGTAADLIKIAMIRIDEYLSTHQTRARLILQIHDELIFALPKDEVETVAKDLVSLMENAVRLPVKLSVEMGVGHSWHDAKS